MSPEEFFKEHNVFHIIDIKKNDESSCIVTIDSSSMGNARAQLFVDVPKERLEKLKGQEIGNAAEEGAQRILKAFQKNSCEKIEKVIMNSCKQSHKDPAPFSVGDRVQVTWGEYKGNYAIVVSHADRGVNVDVQDQEGYAGKNQFYLYERVRPILWTVEKDTRLGLARISNPAGAFVLTLPELAQDICNQLNKL